MPFAPASGSVAAKTTMYLATGPEAIHDFFQSRGFIHLHSPIVTLSDTEGAGEMFRVSTLDAASPPLAEDGSVDFGQDFFGHEAFLTVSGQL